MFTDGGGLRLYHYHQDLSGKYGEGIQAGQFQFKKNQFYHIQYFVQLNEPLKEQGGCGAVCWTGSW